MRDTLGRKFAQIQEWSGVERGCIPAAMVSLCFLQYVAWALYSLYCDPAGVLVQRTAVLAFLPQGLAVIVTGVLLTLLGLVLRKRAPKAEWFQHLTTNFYTLALVWGGFLIGPLNFTTALVLCSAPIVGFIILSRRVMLVAVPIALFAMLGINVGAAYGLLPYAPLLVEPHDTAGALFWTHSQVLFALPHIVVNTTLCAVLLVQWRRREAGVLAISLTDVLTGAHNRRSILHLLDGELARGRRSAEPLAVVLLDLDHFKKINDTHGHPMGDRVLQETTLALQACIRKGDELGRFGGEEFLLLLPHTDREGARLLAERCRAALVALRITAENGEPVPVSGSFGLACTDGRAGITAEALVRAADEALYASKSGGRNRVTEAPALPAGDAPAEAATSRAVEVNWEGRLRHLSAVTDASFHTLVDGKPWWKTMDGWRGYAASVREWSPVAKCGLIMAWLMTLVSGVLGWQLYMLSRPDSAALLDPVVARHFAWQLGGIVAGAGVLLLAARHLRRRAPAACWFQHLVVLYYSFALISIGYVLGMFNVATGAVLMASPMQGFLLFRRSIVVPTYFISLLTVFGIAYASALGLLPYAPLLPERGSHYQWHAPYWVYSNFFFLVPILLVVWGLSYQIFGRWRAREAEIRAISLTDALTRVHNRRSILARLETEVQRSARLGAPLTVALLDLDHFKSINDTWGHPTGDRVLQEAAKTLREAVRECDAVGRYGGEEFLLVLPETSLPGALALLERCRVQLTEIRITADSGERFAISASFGVTCNEHCLDAPAETLARVADEALYEAKKKGRNRVEVLLPELAGSCDAAVPES
jgi:diguanylate cyclase (GGDEF)-like protein